MPLIAGRGENADEARDCNREQLAFAVADLAAHPPLLPTDLSAAFAAPTATHAKFAPPASSWRSSEERRKTVGYRNEGWFPQVDRQDIS